MKNCGISDKVKFNIKISGATSKINAFRTEMYLQDDFGEYLYFWKDENSNEYYIEEQDFSNNDNVLEFEDLSDNSVGLQARLQLNKNWFAYLRKPSEKELQILKNRYPDYFNCKKQKELQK